MFTVPPPKRYRLARPPLAQAVVQVRFPLVSQFHRLAGIELLQSALAELLPFVHREEVHDVSIAIDSEGEMASKFERMIVWAFDDEAGWTLRLSPGSAALSVGAAYRGVEDFAARLAKVLGALVETDQVRRCERLAIRYLNVVDLPPELDKGYAAWFHRELVGWVGSDLLAPEARLVSSLSQVQIIATPDSRSLGVAADIQAAIRSGLVPAGSEIPLAPGNVQRIEREAYVLDLELFIEANQPFHARTLVDQFLYLHAQVDGFFRWSLTDAGAAHFGLEEL
jgi:uncharacterized protein (TIGR04255 family)